MDETEGSLAIFTCAGVGGRGAAIIKQPAASHALSILHFKKGSRGCLTKAPLTNVN